MEKRMIEYKKYVGMIENAIKEEHPLIVLEKIVLELFENGKSKKEIYEFFLKFYVNESESKQYLKVEKEFGDHPVEETMDRLCGWCNRNHILLPNESIE